MDASKQNSSSENARNEDLGPVESAKKPYSSPKLTRYGQMSQLTKLGGGDGDNDGDNEYGRPLS